MWPPLNQSSFINLLMFIEPTKGLRFPDPDSINKYLSTPWSFLIRIKWTCLLKSPDTHNKEWIRVTVFKADWIRSTAIPEGGEVWIPMGGLGPPPCTEDTGRVHAPQPQCVVQESTMVCPQRSQPLVCFYMKGKSGHLPFSLVELPPISLSSSQKKQSKYLRIVGMQIF